MPELHAKLGPSSAERWMNCPGSVVLCEGIPGKTSAHAEEGTRAHEVAEAMLKGHAFKSDPDMILHVNVYVQHIQELAKAAEGNLLFIEHRVKITDDLWGTTDAVIWEPTTATLYVRDLKYGAGVAVEVSNNLQLKLYALATLLTMKLPARTVNVGIVQPRLNHPDGPIRSKDFDAVDLIDFHAEVMEAVAAVNGAAWEYRNDFPRWEECYLHPTEKGCRWCLAAPTCPALKAKTKELVKQAFTPATPYKPEELAEALDYAPILEGWIKNLREFAYAEAEKGNPIPGYKLVEKKPTRKLKTDIDPAALAKALGVSPGELYADAPFLGITELQKFAPGKNDKDRAAVLDPFVTKESSGHTLVHESDKRPAIRVDAKAAFTE